MTTLHPGRPRPFHRALAIAVLIAAAGCGLSARPAAAADPAPAGGAVSAGEAVPACTRGDDLAPYRGASQWRSTLLDTRYRLPRSYVPPGLVSTANAGTNGGSRVRRVVIEDLRAMVRAARRAGIAIRVNSGYRSYHEQAVLYRAEVARVGVEAAALVVARPGHSEHQLGTALDIGRATGAYAFLRDQGWRFGFVVSYPRGGRATTCYSAEPWHVRYYGRARAAAIHDSGLVPRAWLWLHVVAVAR